jgi:hypothetical protein
VPAHAVNQERRVWLARIAITKGAFNEARQQIATVSVQALVNEGSVGIITAAIGVMIDSRLLSQAEREGARGQTRECATRWNATADFLPERNQYSRGDPVGSGKQRYRNTVAPQDAFLE